MDVDVQIKRVQEISILGSLMLQVVKSQSMMISAGYRRVQRLNILFHQANLVNFTHCAKDVMPAKLVEVQPP